MTTDDFVALINNAVRFYPVQSMKCLQPQTFALLDSDDALNEKTLGKVICDKNKPYYYSRLWDNMNYNPSKISSWEYPLVTLFEQAGDLKGLHTRQQELTYTYQISVIDNLKETGQQATCHGCAGRVVNDLYRDTEEILMNVLHYLDDVVVAFVDGANRLYNAKHFEYLIDEGIITGTIDDKATAKFTSDNKNDNTARAFHRTEPFIINAKVYGTTTTIRFTLPNCKTMEFDFRNGKTEIPDKGCC